MNNKDNKTNRKSEWRDALSSISPPVKNPDLDIKQESEVKNKEQFKNDKILPAGQQAAGFMQRSAAYVWDILLLILITMPFYPEININQSNIDEVALVNIASSIISFAFLQLTVWAIYCITFETLWGTTIGKFIVGIKVIDVSGSKPTFFKIVLRFLTSSLSWITMNIGHAMIYYREDKASLHDIMSGTKVVIDDDVSLGVLPKPNYKLRILATPISFTVIIAIFLIIFTKIIISAATMLNQY